MIKSRNTREIELLTYRRHSNQAPCHTIPNTVTYTVNASDGIKQTSAQAARVYRQKYRQTGPAATGRVQIEMTKTLIFFNQLAPYSREFRASANNLIRNVCH
jgi:hypothetical protein